MRGRRIFLGGCELNLPTNVRGFGMARNESAPKSGLANVEFFCRGAFSPSVEDSVGVARVLIFFSLTGGGSGDGQQGVVQVGDHRDRQLAGKRREEASGQVAHFDVGFL